MIWAFRKSTLEVDLKKSIFFYGWFSQTVALKFLIILFCSHRIFPFFSFFSIKGCVFNIKFREFFQECFENEWKNDFSRNSNYFNYIEARPARPGRASAKPWQKLAEARSRSLAVFLTSQKTWPKSLDLLKLFVSIRFGIGKLAIKRASWILVSLWNFGFGQFNSVKVSFNLLPVYNSKRLMNIYFMSVILIKLSI